MKLLALIVIFMAFSINSYAKISELNFQPKRGEVFSVTRISHSRTDFLLDFDASVLETQIDESVFTQTLTLGVYDSLSLSVDLPFLFDGTTDTSLGGLTAEEDLSSELRRSVFRAVYSESFSDRSMLFLSLSYQEGESDEDSSILIFNPSYRFTSGRSSLLISGLVANYTSTDTFESYIRFGLSVTSQTYFGDSFFIRGTVGLIQDTDQEFRDGSIPILFNPELGYAADFSLGYELKEYNLFFLLGASSLVSDFEPEAIGLTGRGELSNFSYFLSMGYLL